MFPYPEAELILNTAYNIPGTQMTSIFEGQPPQNKVFSNQNKGHLGSRQMRIPPF